MNLIFIGVKEKEKTMAASSPIIHHDYYSHLKFESGPFPFEKDKNYISTNQHVPSIGEKKERGRECNEEEHGYFNTNEAVLKKADPGKDGRQPVDATETFPYSIHAKIEMRFTDGKYGGSGSLIGPRHVLTCGHNVYDNKTGWAESIKVYPGRHGTYAPFGETKVARVYIFKKWEETQEKTYDIALLVLDDPVGTSSGWGGIKCALSKKSSLFDEKNRFSVTGYPGDKGFNYMHTMEYQLDHYTPQILRYLHDTNKGQSGSAIWRKENDQIKIIGVHTSGPASGQETNSGVRLTKEIAEELLIKKVRETYTLEYQEAIVDYSERPVNRGGNPTARDIAHKAIDDSITASKSAVESVSVLSADAAHTSLDYSFDYLGY